MDEDWPTLVVEKCDEEEATQSFHKQDRDGPFLPPLTPANKLPPASSPRPRASANSPRIRSSLNSQRSSRSSLSSRTSRSLTSPLSGNSTLKDKHSQSLLSRSVDSETLAIAVELSKLRERRKKDEQDTLARIMDASDLLGSFLRTNSRKETFRPESTVANTKITDFPTPTGVYDGQEAHFLKRHTPSHIGGSRALGKTKSGSHSRKNFVFNTSPLHRPEKWRWMDKLIDPKASGLYIPTAVPPRIIDYPCTWENTLKEETKKYQLKLHTSKNSQTRGHTPSSPPTVPDVKPKTPTLTSLPLTLQTKVKRSNSSNLELSGSMFSKAHVAPMSWFIVHPDFRNEPRIVRTGEELEGTKDINKSKD